MNLQIFKFLLKNGLALPRNIEELEYVKKNVLNENDDKKIDTPTFQETWEYISKKQSEESDINNELDYPSDSKGMAQAARFGGEINDEVRNQMNRDKKEARKIMNNDNREEKEGNS